MNFRIVGPLTLLWIVLLFGWSWIGTPAGLLFDLRIAQFVGLFPWLVAFITHGHSAIAGALADPLFRQHEDLPQERRERSANVLRSVGRTTFAAGILAFFGSYSNLLSQSAQTTGNATVDTFVGGLGSMLLAPVYGLALRAFLYEPLAGALSDPVDRPASE